MYPKPYSIYLRGTVFVFVGKGLKRKITQPSCEAGAGTSSSSWKVIANMVLVLVAVKVVLIIRVV